MRLLSINKQVINLADEIKPQQRMRSSVVVRAYDNATVATVLGSIPASVGTVESEGQQMKQC